MIEKCTACGWLVDYACGCPDGKPKETVPADWPPRIHCRTPAACSGLTACPRTPVCNKETV